MRRPLVEVALWLAVAASGCGRIGFDLVGGTGDGANGDGAGSNDDGATVDGPSVLSCVNLAPTCGPTGSSDCCESPLVPGGAYYRSYDGVGFGDTSYPATVSTFRLDKYEVTVGRFRQFVDAGYGTQQDPPAANSGARTLNGMANQGGWDPAWTSNLAADTTALHAAIACDATYQVWTAAPGGNESRPMNCISWYEAMAFCAWDGGFLPTEAEWNYAAHGGNLQRAYPWSDPPGDLTIDGTRASYRIGADCVGDGMPGCAQTDLVPVGSMPAGDGLWGHSDLGGNVWEWVLDWYADPYPMSECNDCANLTVAFFRVPRGGGFNDLALVVRGAVRSDAAPSGRSPGLGVRCARTP
jgi:formylglycine-generating enzyme